MKVVRTAYSIMFLSCLFGIYAINNTLNHSDTVFQQIAGMVEGLCFVIVPYCMCKAIAVIFADSGNNPPEDKTKPDEGNADEPSPSESIN